MLAEAIKDIEQGTGSGLGWMDDSSLVDVAKQGDQLAFEILVERHKRTIFFRALRVTGNHEDAEDVVQQSFQKAFVHLNDFEGRSSFATWLTRIALNEASDVTTKVPEMAGSVHGGAELRRRGRLRG